MATQIEDGALGWVPPDLSCGTNLNFEINVGGASLFVIAYCAGCETAEE
ncbi:hypothetical protein [Engelhardtia mirabilis]